MYSGIVYCQDEQLKRECLSIFENIGGVKPSVIQTLGGLEGKEVLVNCLCIIVSDLDANVLKHISTLENFTPGLTSIFYNHSLTVSDLPEINNSPKVKMVIGENRQTALAELISKLKAHYWRKIPYEQFEISYESLSPRMRKAMDYIETAPLGSCNISTLASRLKLSQGYFSQEFKRETGSSFRRFMQDLIAFYENEIVSKINLPAKNISQILGYSELSSFSRSFKKRKGVSPSQYKKQTQS